MSSRVPEELRRATPHRRVLALAVALPLLAGLPAAARSVAPPEDTALPSVEAPGYRPRIEPHELWVVELTLGDRVLDRGMLVIDRGGELLLPLAAMADAFELAIEVDADRARAFGFVIHPGRTFELDLSDRDLRIEGQPRELGPGGIVVWSQDIYVEPETLARWLPVDLDVNRRTLRVEARSREALPIEKRLARERLHARLGLRRGDGPGGSSEDPYRWWTSPSLDVNLRSRVQRPGLDGDHDWTALYDVASAGDLLKLHTELLASGADADSLRLRARAGRVDPEGGLGGPLGLREFTLGDVYTPSIDQLSTGRSGRGFQVSSFPLGYANDLGQLTLEGDLPPGYQVELYRGDVLLDFQVADEELRYRFEDVPTVPGLNVLRLVFYGPRGEQREEVRRIWGDGGLAKPGETRFRMTVNQHDQDTLLLGDIGGDDRLRGDPRAIGELEYGFERLTLAVSAASLPLLEGRFHYGSLSLRSELDGHLLRLEGFSDFAGGFAAGTRWQTRLGGQAIGLSHHEYQDFLSERTRQLGGTRLRGRTAASLDGTLQMPRLPISYRVAAGHSRLTRGDVDLDGQLGLSTWLRPVFLTHVLRGRLDQELGQETRALNGDLLASFRQGDFGLRGRFLYSALPGEAQSVSLIGDWSPQGLGTTRLGISHAFGGRTTLSSSFSRRLGAFVLTASASVDEKGLATAGVGISFGALPNPFTGRPGWQPPGATRTGSVAARTFLDRNANGRFDAGDRALRDVGFRARGGARRTDEDGTVMLTQLPADRPLEVAVDPATVLDPHWVLPRESERLVLRPGTPVAVDFPILPVGEIDGWVMRPRAGEPVPLPGVSVELLDESGAVVATQRSEIDGFFLFQEVLPGRYRLQLDPGQLARMDVEAPPAREVEILDGGSVVSDQTFVVREP